MRGTSISTMRDAVHGRIRILDPVFFQAHDGLIEILGSPIVTRLQAIRQLPFSSSEFLAADHTRYAHSLGTAHAGMAVLRRLKEVGFFAQGGPDAAFYPGIWREHDHEERLALLGEHITLACLLQDLGELPYKIATDLYFSARHDLRVSLADDFGERAVSRLTSKTIFTLEAIREVMRTSPEATARFDFHLLAYLIAGVESETVMPNPQLKSLRNVVDGVVDADRLDYVHRDAYHTLGRSLGSSLDSVVGSLVGLDVDGPIFDSPGPVSNFIMLRGILRHEVYSSPDARLNFTMLSQVLSRVYAAGKEALDHICGSTDGSLSLGAFLELDDSTLMGRLQELTQGKFKHLLDRSSRQAMDILTASVHDYSHYWLTPPGRLPSGREVEAIPSDVFVDTYIDGESHRLYRPGSVRVLSTAFSAQPETLPLESVAGHVGDFLSQNWDATPIGTRILFFVPGHRLAWFQHASTDGEAKLRLYRGALARDAEVRMSVPDDTRETDGFTGPAIFISFSWNEIHLARATLRLLCERRRRYFAFVRDYHGVGGDTGENSVSYARAADASIVLLSRGYIAAACNPDSNIRAEIEALGNTLEADRIVFLQTDPQGEVDEDAPEEFPWRLVGRVRAPFMGAPVSPNNPHHLEEAVEAALRSIDTASSRDSSRGGQEGRK